MAAITLLFLILQALLLVSKTHGICNPISYIQHGEITYDTTYAYYRVSCNPGYIIFGSPLVLCEQNEWNSSPPTCIKSVCEELLAPKNGGVECDKGPLSAGKACRLTCSVGYELKGSETRICTSSKTGVRWSGIETECTLIFRVIDPLQRILCPLPQPLSHGSVIGCTSQDMPRVDSKCNFRCNNGYTLRGPSSLTCTSSGRYVDDKGIESFPECVVDNGYRHHSQTNYNHYSTYREGGPGASTEIYRNPCKNLGGCQHICKNVGGLASCRCRNGFDLAKDQKHCIEASSSQPVQYHSEFTHYSSNPHHNRNVKTTAKYEETKLGNNDLCFNHQCEQLCRTEEGRAQCRCKRGFLLNQDDQRTCIVNTGPTVHPPRSLNPCASNKGGCQHRCRLKRGGQIKCDCFEGYHLHEDGRSCIFIELECKSDAQCPLRHICVYDRCISGCHSDENCGFEEACINRVCQNPCSSLGACGRNANCRPINHKPECTCPTNFRGNPNVVCEQVQTSPRPPRVTCYESNGGCEDKCTMRGYNVVCSCRKGYKLDVDRKHCIDIDECKVEGICHHSCENIEGGYICSCLPGYVMIDNHKCEGCRKHSYWSTEKNGCVDCPANSFTESDGKTSINDCFCRSGFSGSPKDNIPCVDIDECATDNFGCSHTCVNTPGDVFCSCPFGFTVDKDNKTCIDIDECSIKNGGCEGICTNTNGSFFCRCPAGYMSSNKDIYSCDDINECEENNGGCQQLCVNHRGSYYCSCEEGYRLDSTLKNCIGISCPALPVPHFSTMRCKRDGEKLDEMDNYPIGTRCSFKCISGFKDASESNRMECQEDGTWEGGLAICKSQRCPALDAPENGDVHPASCSEEGNLVKQKCTFTCRRGYKLKGIAVFSCKNNLTWDHPMEAIPVCQPEEIRASMECTRDVRATLLPGKSSHIVTIPEPSTNMDSYEISPKGIPVGKPFEFQAGITKVVFTTSSPRSNRTAKCVTTVHVIDKEPPVFYSCPDPIVIENAKIDGEIVTWEEPEVFDNVKVQSLKPSVEPNTTLIPGSYVVEYVARDPAGNTETCSFKIDIIRLSCDNLTDPAHGEANCMDWLYGNLCQPLCDEGYMRNPSDSPFYSCGDSGIWEPSDKITDCLRYTEAESSLCPEGMEFKIIEETDEEICLECPSNAVWSSTTQTCEGTTV